MEAFSRANQLIRGLASLIPLYVIRDPFGGPYGMGWIEITWDFGNLAMLLAGIILSVSGPWIIPKIGAKITAGRITLFTLFANFIGALVNHMSDVAFIGGALLALLPEFASFLIYKVVPALSWFLKAAAIADISAQVAAIVGSGTTAAIIKVIQILSVIGSMIWWVLGVYSDITDEDDKANMPEWLFGG